MKRALLVIGAWGALLAGTPAGGAATEICFPPAFSVRIGEYGTDAPGIAQTDLYADLHAQQERLDVGVGAGRTRYYFDFPHGRLYEYLVGSDHCQHFTITGTLEPFCASTNAQRVAVETLAGQSAERWCDDLYHDGKCTLAIYTVTQRGVRIPRIIRSFDVPGTVFVDVYTDLVVHEHGLPPSTFALPHACAVLP